MKITQVDSFTPRETEIARMVADGLSNKAIAKRLQRSQKTIMQMVSAACGKLVAQPAGECAPRVVLARFVWEGGLDKPV